MDKNKSNSERAGFYWEVFLWAAVLYKESSAVLVELDSWDSSEAHGTAGSAEDRHGGEAEGHRPLHLREEDRDAAKLLRVIHYYVQLFCGWRLCNIFFFIILIFRLQTVEQILMANCLIIMKLLLKHYFALAKVSSPEGCMVGKASMQVWVAVHVKCYFNGNYIFVVGILHV